MSLAQQCAPLFMRKDRERMKLNRQSDQEVHKGGALQQRDPPVQSCNSTWAVGRGAKHHNSWRFARVKGGGGQNPLSRPSPLIRRLRMTEHRHMSAHEETERPVSGHQGGEPLQFTRTARALHAIFDYTPPPRRRGLPSPLSPGTSRGTSGNGGDESRLDTRDTKRDESMRQSSDMIDSLHTILMILQLHISFIRMANHLGSNWKPSQLGVEYLVPNSQLQNK